MTEEEYQLKLARAEELTALDPEPNSDIGRELLMLVDQINAYEMEKFPELFSRKLVEDFRGGKPEKCSFCGKVTAELEPWEAGEWACNLCADREYEDARQEQYDSDR